jgi:putative ABC transport system permease protein
MLRSYLTAAIRNFTRNRLHFLINVFGLALGLASTLLASMFVIDETSFDRFHRKGDRLYRLNKIALESTGERSLNAESSGMMGPTMVSEFPEVESIVRYQPWFDDIVLSNDTRSIEIPEKGALFVDSTFFQVFDFKLITGSKSTVLNRPSTIVLTPRVASALFAGEDPIGKSVTGVNGVSFEVTGIAEPAPRNSHIQYHVLMSFTTTTPQLGPMPMEWMNNWIAQSVTTYVLLKEGASGQNLASKLPQFMKDHLPTRVENYQLYLQPFNEIYLADGDIKYHRMSKEGSMYYVYVFSMIAIFILVLACVNYINIQTSRSVRRAREVGMRKTLGATRRQLIGQFLGESFIVTAMSAWLAIALVFIALPYFNDVSGKELPFYLLWRIDIICIAVALVIVVALISGIYPAFVLASFRPGDVLKLHATKRLVGNLSRDVLITFQFVISIVMISCAMLVYQQVKYMHERDLGFDKDHVLVVSLADELMPKGATFEEQIERHPQVVNVSRCRSAMGAGSSSTFLVPEGFPPDEIEARMFPVDGEFMKTYGLQLDYGRFFNVSSTASDSGAVVINQTLARRLKWDDATKKTIKFSEDGVAYPVIGVLKDFNYKSLYSEVEPVVMFISGRNAANVSIRFTGNPASLLSFLESTWKSYGSRYPFKYFFVDATFASYYESEQNLFRTVIAFSVLSIIIACLGLYGIVSFTIEQRTKEFGIRKVLGASVAGLNLLVNRRFVWLILIASIMATAAALPLMNRWLAKFAFRIEPGADVFAIAALATLLVTVLAVSFQAVRAARTNPASTLRAE